MKNNITSKAGIVFSMVIFGTIGVFAKYIPLPSSVIAVVRGLIATLFIAGFMLITKKKPDFTKIKSRLILLIVSGACIGFNWILLFESYRYTTVATATLCYYTQPIILILLSPIILKEKFSVKKLFCVAVALAGMYYLSGIAESGMPKESEAVGILLALGAALLYAIVVIINKKISDVNSYDRTVIQMFSGAAVCIPYVLLTEDVSSIKCDTRGIILLIILGAIHTGFAYTLYFACVSKVHTGTVAVISYLDPTVAVILSIVILKEPFNIYSLVGAVLILGAALVSELPERKKK